MAVQSYGKVEKLKGPRLTLTAQQSNSKKGKETNSKQGYKRFLHTHILFSLLPPLSLPLTYLFFFFFFSKTPPPLSQSNSSMRVPLHLLRQLKTIAWLWGTLSLLAPLASAQAPALVCCMAYTTINENTFFIQGGLLITGPGISSNTSQFYSLDLTQPTWNTLNPPWKPLTYPATLVPLASTAGHSMSVAQDNSGFTMWMASNLVATYNIGSNSWGQIVPTPPATLFKGSNLQAATDPTSGLVYIPGAAGTPNSMSVFSSSTGMSLSVPMPPTLVAAGAFYSFVWSKVRKTFIYYGGNAATPNPFFEFSPSAGKWTSMVSLVNSNIPLKGPNAYEFVPKLLC